MHLIVISVTLLLAVVSVHAGPLDFDDFEDDFGIEASREKRASKNPQLRLIGAMFHDGDENKDAMLTVKEFWTVFSHFDGNGDGAITPREHLDFFMNQPALRHLRSSGMLPRMAVRQFRAGDKNNDGVLTSADAEIIFDNLDMNDDTLVSKHEFFSRFHEVLS